MGQTPEVFKDGTQWTPYEDLDDAPINIYPSAEKSYTVFKLAGSFAFHV